MHSRHNAFNNNKNEMSSTNNNNNIHNVTADKTVLNPLASASCDYNNNNNNTYHRHSLMTHDEMTGLRAASHVSMEGQPDAHEYNPTCKCSDCQYLLTNFTNYNLVDAFTAQHLTFERNQQAVYGFVPCVGGPYGEYAYIASSNKNEQQQQPQYVRVTDNTVFHMHLHHMRSVPAEVRERSYNRFFTAPAPASATATMSIPAPRNHRRNNNNNNRQQHYYPNSNNATNNKQQSFASHNNTSTTVAAPSYNDSVNYNNYYGNNTSNNAAADNNNSYNYNYNQRDVEQATRSVAFSGVAQLGN